MNLIVGCRTTPVPNVLFDVHLKTLKPAALKLVLLVIRQTWGWQEKNSKKRKQKDWLSGSQLREKTGCSRRALTDATEQLVRQGLIEVTDENGTPLRLPHERRGQAKLFYQFRNEKIANASANTSQNPKQKLHITKEIINKKLRFTTIDLELFESELNRSGCIESLLLEKHAIKFVDGHRIIITNDQPERYKELFLPEYEFPGIKVEALRTPYAVLMELYHHYEHTKATNS